MIDRDFRVGDKVTCNMFGLGKVIEIDNDYITVIFSNKIIGTYSKDGKYNTNFKRTLFIIPKQKPTDEEILNKFNELVNNTPEVYFIPNERNYYVEGFFDYEENKYNFDKCYNKTIKFLRTKYISETTADSILTEMNNFIKGE